MATPFLVKDINPGSFLGPNSSDPSDFTVIGDTLFFIAQDSQNNGELWKSDGTEAGTVLVKNISPLFSSYPYGLTVVGDTLFFSANDGLNDNGRELWKSDGTEAGTVLVKDIYPDLGGASPSHLIAVGNTLFFSANNGLNGNGRELWKSDGTEAGTVLVKDIYPGSFFGPNSSSPTNLTGVLGDTLFFVADDGTNGRELWKSDGTEAGTVLVKDINPGTSGSYPGTLPFTLELVPFTTVGNTLFFTANDGTNGRELWKSDGTSAGTVLVKDINPGNSSSDPRDLTVVSDTLFFIADDGTGEELWKSDGTTAGTVLVKDIGSTSFSPGPNYLTAVGDTLFFTADDGVINGRELWKSDGTEAGTVLVKNIHPSLGSLNDSNPLHLTAVGDTLFFSADDGTNGRELWKSDGTEAGTILVADINPSSSSLGSIPSNLMVVGNTLFFGASDGTNGGELWALDVSAELNGFLRVAIAATDSNAVEEGQDSGQFTVTLSEASATDITVNYTVGGTATPNLDYTALTGTVTIAAGNTISNPIVVTPLEDTEVESLETVVVTLTDSADYDLGTTPTATVTIVDSNESSSPGGSDDFTLTTKDEIYEYLAKDIVYKDWEIGDLLGFNGLDYTVDAVFENENTGFYSLGLISNNPLTLSPVLAFRGTEPTADRIAGIFPADIIADIYVSDVGFGQFENGLSLISNTVLGDSVTISEWVNKQNNPTLLGHSLGGALTQLFASELTSQGSNLGDVYTFNSPGISRNRADRFDASKVQEVKHNIVSGDVVSLVGEDYIEGGWELFLIDEGGFDNFLNNHLNPIFAPEVGYDSNDDDKESQRPTSITSEKFSSIDNLANLFFTYPTTEYFSTLLAPSVLSIAAVPVIAPAVAATSSILLFRVTAETARKGAGAIVLAIGSAAEAIGNLGDLSGTLAFPEIDLGLINLNDLQISLNTDEGRLIAQGEIVAGPSIDIQLPSWAGGTISTPNIIRLDATAGFTDFGELKGDTQIFLLENVAQGEGEVTIDFINRSLNISGGLSFLNGFIETNQILNPTANLDLATSGTGTINFPDIEFTVETPEISLPFGITIPGTSKQISLAGNSYSGSYQLLFTNDGDLSNDYIWGGGRVTPLPGMNFDLGLQVFLNGNVTTTFSQPTLPEVGSFDVVADTPWIVLNAVWENSNPDVIVEIIAPDGTIFSEDTWDTSRFAIVEDLTTDTSRSVGILNPEEGIWDIQIVDETGLGVVDYSGFRDSVTPTLAITDVAANDTGSEVTITYNALDADSDATLSFFYDSDNQGFDGILIATNITEADGTATYTWNTQGVAPGTYYIYASAFDGNNAPVQTYSVGTIEVTEATATDVAVDTVASAEIVEPGDSLTYTITVTNSGNIEATGVSLTETLAEGSILLSTSLTPENQSDNVLTFDLGTLDAGASTTIEVTIAAPATVPESGFISNRSQISSLTFDTNFINDVAIVGTTLNTAPTLNDLEKTALEDEVITFESTDFSSVFEDEDEDSLQSIEIAALLLGTLRLNGTEVAVNDSIPLTQLANLEYTPPENATGALTAFQIRASDGLSNSEVADVIVNLTPVNDAPSFTLTEDPDQLAQAGQSISIENFATNISVGPDNESTQTPTFNVSVEGDVIFDLVPEISAVGTLTYAVAEGSFGQASVRISLSDDGGTANGGFDTSPEQTFSIRVSRPENPVEVDFEADDQGLIGAAFAYNTTPAGQGSQVTTRLIDDVLNLGVEAVFDNLTGLYEVVNRNGGILDGDTVLLPGDNPSRYAELAITNRVSAFSIRSGSSGDPNRNTTVEQFGDVLLAGGKLYAPFVIANAGVIGFDGFVEAENAESDGVFNNAASFANDRVAYFAFLEANPDGVAHLQSRGNNIFGFEDLPSNLGISDNDFNDAVFAFSFAAIV